MKLKNIIEALNHYHLDILPNAKGFFIGKESNIPTQLNAYKTYKVEIFYHLPNKNVKVLHVQIVDRGIEAEAEAVKTRVLTEVLTQIFMNMNKITDKIKEYETL